MELIACKRCKAVIPDSFAFCPSCGREVAPKPRAPKRKPKGYGSVYKLGGKRANPWAVSKGGVFLGCFSDRAQAECFLAQARNASGDPLNLTLGDIRDRWMATRRYKRLSKDAKANYDSVWTRLEPHRDVRMRDTKTYHLQSAVELAQAQGHGRDIYEKIRSLASILCQEAMKDDIIDRNYALGIELPERSATKKMRNFQDDEIILLFDHDELCDVQIILC